MQPSVNGSTSMVQNDTRPASVPASGRSTPTAVLYTNSKSASQSEKKRETAALALTDQEPDDAFQAWDTVEDEDDSFFDAPSDSIRSPSPRPATKYDDKGEPDFAGWLAAQSQAKLKKPLPRGLTKTSSDRPNLADRTTSTGTIGSGVGPRRLLNTISKPKIVVPAKKIDTKPKEIASTEDGWGDDWD